MKTKIYTWCVRVLILLGAVLVLSIPATMGVLR